MAKIFENRSDILMFDDGEHKLSLDALQDGGKLNEVLQGEIVLVVCVHLV